MGKNWGQEGKARGEGRERAAQSSRTPVWPSHAQSEHIWKGTFPSLPFESFTLRQGSSARFPAAIFISSHYLGLGTGRLQGAMADPRPRRCQGRCGKHGCPRATMVQPQLLASTLATRGPGKGEGCDPACHLPGPAPGVCWGRERWDTPKLRASIRHLAAL